MCLFCKRKALDVVYENERVFAVFDSYPVNPGHALIIPKRHVEDVFSMTEDEWKDVFTALSAMKKTVEAQFAPDGFNIGSNIGETAGQTIFHAHIHLIPRYRGDVREPRGGVRGVLPDKRLY